MSVQVEGQEIDVVVFEIEGIFRGVAVVGVAVDDAHEHSLGDLTQKEVFSVHAHAPRRYDACLDEHAFDGIFGGPLFQGLGVSQTDGRTYFDFSHHQGDVSQFAFVVVATGHQVKGGFMSDQLDFDVDSVQDVTFLKRHVQMQASREVHGLTLASQVESLFEALVVGRASVHVSRRVLVPKDGSQLRLFGLRAVIQQIFQVGAVRVGVVGVRNQFVVQRQFDVGKHGMHPVVDGAEVVDVVADGRAVGLDDLGFDQQDGVMQVDVIVPGSRHGKRHRDLVTVDGTEGFVLDPMSRFDVDLGGGNGKQVQFGFHAFARLSVDQSHCDFRSRKCLFYFYRHATSSFSSC